MQITPNPSSGVVELYISGVEGVITIMVSDLLGQIIYSCNISLSNSTTAYLPAHLWPSGTYIILGSAGGQIATERLIVE
jgi:hypothetical protein